MSEVQTRLAGDTSDRKVLRPSASAASRRMSLSSVMPILLTLAAVVVAGLFGWFAWDVYMGRPWTRDGMVRAYVVTVAPEVAGRIVNLPVADNQMVRKGDVLFEIEP